jgi:hypothetical protein
LPGVEVQLAVLQILDLGREAEAQEKAETEHMVCRAGGVGVVLGDTQVGLVRLVMQSVENVCASLIVAAITLVWNGPYRPDTWV